MIKEMIRGIQKKKSLRLLPIMGALALGLMTDPHQGRLQQHSSVQLFSDQETTEVAKIIAENHFIIEYPSSMSSKQFVKSLETKGLKVYSADGADNNKPADVIIDYSYEGTPFMAVETESDRGEEILKSHAQSWVPDELVVLTNASDDQAATEIADLRKVLGADIAGAYGATGKGVSVDLIGTGIAPDGPAITGISTHQNCYSEISDTTRSICPSGKVEEHSEIAGTSTEKSYTRGRHEKAAASDLRMVSQGSEIIPTMVGVEVFSQEKWYPSLTHSVILAALNNTSGDVVSLSLGTTENYVDLCDNTNTLTRAYGAIAKRLVQKGKVLVFAAANSGKYGSAAPGCTTGVGPLEQDGVLAVASLNTLFSGLADFSSRARWTTLAAPGEDVLIADSEIKGWNHAKGTSFSTPMVAAAVADLLSRFPDLTPQQVEQLLWEYGQIYHVPYTRDDTGESGVLTIVGINIGHAVVRKILNISGDPHNVYLPLAAQTW